MECYCTNCNAKNPRFFVIRKTDDNCDLCWGPLRPRAVKPVPHPPNIVEFKKKFWIVVSLFTCSPHIWILNLFSDTLSERKDKVNWLIVFLIGFDIWTIPSQVSQGKYLGKPPETKHCTWLYNWNNMVLSLLYTYHQKTYNWNNNSNL